MFLFVDTAKVRKIIPTTKYFNKKVRKIIPFINHTKSNTYKKASKKVMKNQQKKLEK